MHKIRCQGLLICCLTASYFSSVPVTAAELSAADPLISVPTELNTVGAISDYASLPDGDVNKALLAKIDFLQIRAQQLLLAGHELPAEFYPAISRAKQLAMQRASVAVAVEMSATLDGYAAELLILEQNPEWLGTTTMEASGPLIVGERVALIQRYKVGMPLSVGTRLLAATHWSSGLRLQADNAKAPDFVSIRSSNAEVEFKAGGLSRTGLYGSYYGLARVPYFEVIAGELSPEDIVEINYGQNRSGFVLPVRSGRFSLPLFLALPDTNHFMAVPVPSRRLEAGASARLVVDAPSLLHSNQNFDLKIRSEDSHGNLSEGGRVSLDIIVDGVYQQRLDASRQATAVISDMRLPEGSHTITARSGGGGLTGESNPILVDNNQELQLSWLNLHNHSDSSDGTRSKALILAEGFALFDVQLITDHDSYLPGLKGARETDLPMKLGGHYAVIQDNPLTQMALAEIPSDHRVLSRALLAEVLTGASGHEWLGKYFADQGYRIGFTATPTSHVSPGEVLPRTAVLRLAGQSWQEAIQDRRTYVTSGSKAILLVKVNGNHPGSRIRHTPRRQVTGVIVSSEGLADVSLIRNGQVIDQKNFNGAIGEIESVADRDVTELHVKISVASDSAPLKPGFDLPRNGRQWLGYLNVQGAKTATIESSGFSRLNRSAIAINPGDDSRVDFITWTHGTSSSFTIKLSQMNGEDISLEMHIKEGFEDVSLLPEERTPRPTPDAHQHVTMTELLEGVVTRIINVDGYADTISYELVTDRQSNQETFSFVDNRPHGIGDYYYVKVRQTDDKVIWSSPVYVGGFDVE